MKSIVEMSDLHKYVETKDNSERGVTLGCKAINVNPVFLKCRVIWKGFGCEIILLINQHILLFNKCAMLRLLGWRSIACAIHQERDVR